jgi:hypothetical protein
LKPHEPHERRRRQSSDEAVEYGLDDVLLGADLGLPTCPTDGAPLGLNGAGEAAEGEGVHVLAPAAVRLT